MKNNSSFEIPNGRLYFGIQNISKLEASIITKMPEKQTKNSEALDLIDPKLEFFLASIHYWKII